MIRDGELQATKPQGKLLVTELWLSDWLSRCRVTKNLPVSGSSPPSSHGHEGQRARPYGASLTERNERLFPDSRRTRDTAEDRPAKIHARLLPHLRRWHRHDTEAEPPITNVIHYQGEPVGKLRRSWDTVAKQAGSTRKDGPHIPRHSCCTWLMQAGVDVYEVAGAPRTVRRPAHFRARSCGL